MTAPAAASTAPTREHHSYPSPASRTTPPSQAPRALAALSVAWLRAAASDWPSWATSMSRVWIIGTMIVGTQPSRNTNTTALTLLCAAKPKSDRMIAIVTRQPKMPRMSPRMATRSDRNAPAVMPMP